MEVQIFLPDGRRQSYDDVTGLQSENGLVTFYYQEVREAQEPENKKVMTTLPILAEEEVGTPRVSVI